MPAGSVETRNYPEKRRAPADAKLAVIAGRQHGLVTTKQLLVSGADKDAISHRVLVGRLHPVHRGVFAVGHLALTDRGVWLAAVLALGENAVLSHRAAGALLGFLPMDKSDQRPPTDVTVPRRLKPRPGIQPHTARNLRPSDTTMRDGIPVTTAAPTLLDLSSTLPSRALERAMNEALVQHLVNLRQLGKQLDRADGLATAAFRAALADATPTRSGFEDHVLREMRKRPMPRPQTNVRVARFEVDAFYTDRNLVVEFDSTKYHSRPAAQRQDARKQAALEAAGYVVVRVREGAVDEDLDQLEEHHLGRV